MLLTDVCILPFLGWLQAQDQATGRPYYYNKVLGKSQFEFPDELQSPPLPPPPSSISNSSSNNINHHAYRPDSSGAGPSSMEPPSLNMSKRKASEYEFVQLTRERARLRAMYYKLEMTDKEKADVAGEIAAIESDLHHLNYTF